MLSSLAVLIIAMYVPTVYRLFNFGWWRREYSHAPLIFLVFFWLVWRERGVLREKPDGRLHPGALLLLLAGLFCYWLGVRQQAVAVESASMPFVIMGAYYFLLGRAALPWLFPAAYLLFVVPPPIFVVDMITFPLKRVVSVCAARLLLLAGYPVIRKGVLLTVGDYNLLVADACSGMRSIVSLLALISLYVYLQKAPWRQRLLVLGSILPIAIVANIVRVSALALITYHYGEAAGQSFYHDLSGVVVFAVALAGIVAVDKFSRRFLAPAPAPEPGE